MSHLGGGGYGDAAQKLLGNNVTGIAVHFDGYGLIEGNADALLDPGEMRFDCCPHKLDGRGEADLEFWRCDHSGTRKWLQSKNTEPRRR